MANPNIMLRFQVIFLIVIILIPLGCSSPVPYEFMPTGINLSGDPVSDESLRWFLDAANRIEEDYGDGALTGLINKYGIQKSWYLFAMKTCPGAPFPQTINELITRNESGVNCYDLSGKKMLSLDKRFMDMSQFSEGLSIVNFGSVKTIDGKEYPRLGFINNDGQLIIEGEFNAATPFSGGVCAVAVRGATDEKLKWGVIDKKGVWRCAPKYDELFPFSDGVAGANIFSPDSSVAEQAGLVNANGEYILTYPKGCTVYSSPCGGLVLVQTASGYAFTDVKGKTVLLLENKWDEVWPFSYGRSAVRKGDKWGFINVQGEVIVSPKYESCTEYINSMAFVR